MRSAAFAVTWLLMFALPVGDVVAAQNRKARYDYKIGETIPAGLPREEAEARAHAGINALNGELPAAD